MQRDQLSEHRAGDEADRREPHDHFAKVILIDQREQFLTELLQVVLFGNLLDLERRDGNVAVDFQLKKRRVKFGELSHRLASRVLSDLVRHVVRR